MTPEHELVWEYVCPYWGTALPMNMVYRSYRLPYEWVPQLEKPAESPIERLDVSTFRVPGAAAPGVKSAVRSRKPRGTSACPPCAWLPTSKNKRITKDG